MPDSASAAPALVIAKFDKALHDRSAFSCGHAPIDNFLKISLSSQIKSNLISAWVATLEADSAVLGFYTLGAFAVRQDIGPKIWRRLRISDVPAIFIRALAVRNDMQGTGYGTALMIDAMKRCLGISEQMGAAAIILDVLEDEAFERRWQFYAELGFRSLNDHENPKRVYIQMADVSSTIG